MADQQKPTHYQINQLLKEAEAQGITPDMVRSELPNLAPYLEAPNAVGAGLQNLGARAAEIGGNLMTVANKYTNAATAPLQEHVFKPAADYLADQLPQEWQDNLQSAGEQYNPQDVGQRIAKSIPRDTYYAEQYENEDLSVGNVYGLAASEGLASIADMAINLHPLGRAAYAASETERLAQDSAKNDNRTELETSDYLRGAAGAAINTGLEALGGRFAVGDELGNPFIKEGTEQLGNLTMDVAEHTGANVAGKVLTTGAKAGAVEAGTEFLQEGSEYALTHVGTEKGADWQTGLQQAGTGALIGGMVGSHLRGGLTGYQGMTQDKTISALNDGRELDLLESGVTSDLDSQSVYTPMRPNEDQLRTTIQSAMQANPDQTAIILQSPELDDLQKFHSLQELAQVNDIGPISANRTNPVPMDLQTASLDELYNMADQRDKPYVDMLLREAQQQGIELPEEAQRNVLSEVINNTQEYQQGRQQLNAMEVEPAIEKRNQLRRDLSQRIRDTKHAALQERRQELRPGMQFTLARNQQAGQERRQVAADALKEDIVNRVDRPVSGFAGMGEREQQVKSDSVKRQWQGMAQQVKSRRKAFKKKLQIAESSKRAQLEMDRFYRKLEKQEQEKQQEIDRQDWEKTKLARSFRQAQEIGIDGEFNKLATAVQQGIEQLPESIRDREKQKAEAALQEWVSDEFDNAVGAGIDGRSAGISGAVADSEQVGSPGTAPVSVEGAATASDGSENTEGAVTGNGQAGSVVDGRVANDNPVNFIDTAANEAATSPTNDLPEPSEAQIKAGNYKKGKVKLHGMDISIENPKGSVRRGVDNDGKAWETTMQNHYGDIKATTGADGDSIDVFIGDKTESEKVFVVDQVDPATGEFDEVKAMMGFDTKEEAEQAYRANYDKDWQGLGNISETSVQDFKAWTQRPRKSRKPFGELNTTEKASAPVQVEQYGKAWLVKGDTKPIKDNIKEAGGKWNRKLSGWIFPNSKESVAKGFAQQVDAPTEIEQEALPEANTTLHQSLYKSIAEGKPPKNAIEMKKFIAGTRGKNFQDVSLAEEKEAQEAFEGALSQYARDYSKKRPNETKTVLDMLTSKYEKQPNLNVKTATSAKNMAYSTPAPVSFLLNKAAGIDENTSVLEPTAGNGLLLVTNGLDNTTVNELDTKRVNQLKWLGYKDVQTKDATGEIVPAKSKDVVIMNPPFGFTPNPKSFDSADGRSYTLKDIDHIIAAEQLKAMKDDGRAVLVLGANKEPGKVQGGKTGTFMNWLYNNYNVVDHVELDGKVYSRQGAEWPIRLIQIDGRANTGRYGPANGEVERITGDNAKEIIEGLHDRYEKQGLLDPANRKPIGRTASDTSLQSTEESADNRTANQSGTGSKANRPTEPVQPGDTPGTDSIDGRSGTDKPTTKQTSTGSRNKTGRSTSGSKSGSAKRVEPVAKPSPAYQPKTSNVDRSRINTTNATKRLSTPPKSNEFQADYQPGSDGFNENVLIPVNMAQKVQDAMSRFVAEHGSVDGYVAEKLGYDSVEALQKSFMALQVDALALAISKMDQGKSIIIADQTGVGKGRQAAGIIRYALQTGKTPVFISQKPNLFSDMYGDLVDIDTAGVNPYIMNSGEYIVHDGKAVGKQSDKDTKAGLKDLESGKLPDGKNAVFLTYSQINKAGNKTRALKNIAENAVFILDESHTGAGADSQTGEYLRDLLREASGAVYLSATYAKRPDNLGLYHRTSLGDAADNMDELQDAIENGGLQLQTLLASMLSQEGELIRRERSFDGIKVNTVVDSQNKESHEQLFNASTEILQDIIKMSRSFVSHAKKLSKEASKNGESFIGNTTVEKDMKATSFTSVVHNYISQLTMALKAETAAAKAIEQIKNNVKPVIAVESTMESKLNDYMENNLLSVGDSAADFTFGDVFEGAIKNAISLSKKGPNGETEKVAIAESDLPANIQAQIKAIRNKIRSSDMLSEIPISPIDYIRKLIGDAGYSVSEITGRNKYVDYSDGMKIINKPVDESKANRRRIVDRFNDGKLDALILNQSGSTGLSIHASEKFKDQRPRHMIVAQPSLDINTFMQMLGRINRTGQLQKPSYDLLWLDLPSENRPAAVLSGKMKQLNANTSANTDSATSVESIDLFNPYGDQVVKEYLEENPEYLAMMGITIPESDVAQYITGKLAVLPVEKQRDFFDAVEPMYTDFVNHLKAIGEYSLGTQEVDLQAEPISQKVLHKGENKSAFDGDVRLTEARVKKQGKPTSPDDLRESYAKADSEQGKQIAEQARARYDKYVAQRFDKPINDLKAMLDTAISTGESEETLNELRDRITDLQTEKQDSGAAMSSVARMLTTYAAPGKSVKITTDDGVIYGMVESIKYSPGKAGNPIAPSKIKFNVITAGGYPKMAISLTQLRKIGIDKLGTFSFRQLESIFESEYNRPQYETRHIATGNLIKAFSMMQGRVISFTKKGGGKEIGMLMPNKFNAENDVNKKSYIQSIAQVLKYLNAVDSSTLESNGVRDSEGFGFIKHDGEIKVAIPINNSQNRQKYLDENVIAILGDEPTWRKGAKVAYVPVSPGKAKKLFDHLKPRLSLTDTAADRFNEINRIKDDSDKVINSNVRFNKVENANKGKGVPVKAAIGAFNRYVSQYKGLNDSDFEQIITDRKPSDIFGPTVAEDDNYIKGAFDKDTNRLFIFTANHKSIEDIRQTLREELLVHKGLGVLSTQEIGRLITAINDTRNSKNKQVQALWDDVLTNYQKQPPMIQAEEFLGKVAQKRPSFLDKWMNRLVALMSKLFRKMGLVKQSITMSEMRNEVYRIGELLAKGKQADNMDFDTQSAVDSGMRFNRARKAGNAAKRKASEKAGNVVNKYGRKAAFKMLPVNQMADMYDEKYTAGHISNYYDLLEDFGAYKSNELSKLDEGIETRWDDLQKMKPKANNLMSRTMINATMLQISPDEEFANLEVVQDLQKKIDDLEARDTLSAKQQKYHDDLSEQMLDLTDMYKQIREDWQWLEQNSPEAVQLYKDVRQQYQDMYADTKKFLEQRIKDLQTDEQTKGQLMTLVKKQFELQIQKGDYFPLMRHGQFAVMAKKIMPNGETDYIREHYESDSEANEAEKRLRKEGYAVTNQKLMDENTRKPLEGYRMGQEILKQVKEIQDANEATAEAFSLDDVKGDVKQLEKIFDAIEDKAESTALMDAIYQQMLISLPNASAAKRFIHRNRVKGASTDSRRAFADTMLHSINRAAKIQYEHKFAKEIDAIGEIADNGTGPDQRVVRDIHDSLVERNQKTLNPDGSQLAAMASGLGFNWLLGGSLAAGAVNLSQVPLVTYPYLAAKYSGKKARAAMTSAMNDVMTGSKVNIKKGGNAGSTLWQTMSQSDSLMDVSNSSKLSDMERAILQQLTERGKIDLTQMHSMAQIADTETRDNYGVKLPFTNKTINRKTFRDGFRAWGFFFHNAEVFNRQLTALATIRLAVQENPSITEEALYKQTAKAIDETQFNYAAHNRGMWARTDSGKIFLMFLTYKVNMVTLFAKNVRRMFGNDPASRKEASRLVANLFMVHGLAAGALGVPLVQAIGESLMWLKDVADGDDEPDDFKQFMDETVRTIVGKLGGDPNGEVAKTASTLTRKGVFNALMGIDIHSRVGLQDLHLPWRLPDSSEQSGNDMIAQFLYGTSPVFSIAGNFINGAQRVSEGMAQDDTEKTMRGFQSMLPTALSNVVKAGRRSEYGESTLSGSELIGPEQFNGWNTITQALGFGTEKVSDLYERRTRQYKFDAIVSGRKQNLVRKAAKNVQAGDDLADVISSIQKFNKQYPAQAITADTIRRHIKAKVRRDQQTIDGIYTPKSRMGQVGQMQYYDE